MTDGLLSQLQVRIREDLEFAKVVAILALNAVPTQGRWGKPLFEAIYEKVVGLPFEGVMLRWNGPWPFRYLEVFLAKRGSDEAYANLWHAPGTFIGRGEILEVNDFSLAFERLSNREFSGFLKSWELVDIHGGGEERGTSLSLVFLVTGGAPVEIGHGEWWPVDSLPEDTVESHRREIIRRAADEFRFRSLLWVRIGNSVLNMVGAKLARKEEFK